MANDPAGRKDVELGLNGRGGDSESQSSRSTRTKNKILFRKQHASACSVGAKWLALLLMGLLLIAFLVYLIPYLSFTLLQGDNDACFRQLSPFQQSRHRLFSTKTLYTTAYNYLAKQHQAAAPAQPLASQQQQLAAAGAQSGGPPPAGQLQPPQQQQPSQAQLNYDKSSVYVPRFFSPSDSLDTINQRLRSAEFNCKPLQLHFVGRHAARLPDSSGIFKIHKHIASIQARIDLDKHNLNPSDANQPAAVSADGEPGSAPPQPSDTTGAANRSEAVCFDPLVQYKQWSHFAVPQQGNLVTEMGLRETQAIASRFKAMFPEMFNAALAAPEFGTTRELRTGQTALEFMKLVDNYKLDFCNFADFPAPNGPEPGQSPSDSSTSVKADDLQQNACFRRLLDRFANEKLSFHESCRKIAADELPIKLHLGLHDANRTEAMAQSVSGKLKLSKENQLSSDDLSAIYNVCRYESALTGQVSIWCNLFQDRELRLLEYINDVDDFYNQAYGHPDQAHSSCPVTGPLLGSLKALRNALASNTELAGLAPRAHFYFSHSEVIQKVLAASVNLKNDPQYAAKAVLEHLRAGEPPKERQWQTSLLTPFSANLAFVLYSCPSAAPFAPGPQPDPHRNDYTDGPLKLVASLNEQPILLEGCYDYACDLNRLLAVGRLNTFKTCNLSEVCKNRVLVT